MPHLHIDFKTIDHSNNRILEVFCTSRTFAVNYMNQQTLSFAWCMSAQACAPLTPPHPSQRSLLSLLLTIRNDRLTSQACKNHLVVGRECIQYIQLLLRKPLGNQNNSHRDKKDDQDGKGNGSQGVRYRHAGCNIHHLNSNVQPDFAATKMQ